MREAGHEVAYIAEFDAGIEDELVLMHANKASSLLITADKDFGDLVVRHKQYSHGVLLYRLEGMSLNEKTRIVCAFIEEKGLELTKQFTVISPRKIRSRTLPSINGNGHNSF